MNLDELQSIRDRERQSDSLQQLREDFYVEVGEFVQELRDEREAAADRADDPFDAPEVNRLTDDIKTAEQTVEAIYERRVGKLVKMASFAAADMPTEDEGLTAEERELFERMVAAIEGNRETVMSVIDGEDPPATPGEAHADRTQTERTASHTERADTGTQDAASESAGPNADRGGASGGPPQADPTPPASGRSDATGETESVDAADLMAGSDSTPDSSAPTADESAPDREPGSGPEREPGAGRDPQQDGGDPPIPPELRDDSAGGAESGERSETPPEQGSGAGESAAETSAGDTATADSGDSRGTADAESGTVERETVRITADVGQIFGVDEREYDLASEDVVTLPTENATPLVERDVAEPLDRGPR